MSILKALKTTPMAIFDQHQWVIDIQEILGNLEQEEDIPVCIFSVPKPLSTYNPEFYTPQMVSIGPYHHFHEGVKEMGRYKLAAAKRTQKRLQNRTFNSLVEELTKDERKIRGCYHMHLDFTCETLAWMMAVDLSFLLEVLRALVISFQEDKSPNEVSSVGKSDSELFFLLKNIPLLDVPRSARMSHLVDCSGEKSVHNAILRDIIMLENQVPLFVLTKMLQSELSTELAEEVLRLMLLAFLKELSPFEMKDDPNPSKEMLTKSHLLGFLYQTIVPQSQTILPRSQTSIPKTENHMKQSIVTLEASSNGEDVVLSKFGYVKQSFVKIWQLRVKLNIAQVKESSRFKVVVKLPWTIITKLPGFSNIALTLQNIFFPDDKVDQKPEDTRKGRPPLVEEIMIPSVTELYNAGVRFVPSDGNIESISFDSSTGNFLLPVVTLDVNTEVVLRNLVAYEASMHHRELIFTRYTELMNGIIDTEEDVKLLREKGVILNYLKSDREVADIWNGMSKSIRLTRVKSIDGVIADVNIFYSGRWKIKVRNFIRAYVFGSWQFLAFLAGICVILLMTLQAFCSVYTCRDIFRISSNAISSTG